jgi:hypothetical protein
MKRRIGDRRVKPRFEIVGDLWGSLDAMSPMVVQNLGRGGALVEAAVPLAPNSVHWVTATTDGQPHLLQVRVRHSTSVSTPQGDRRYLIGVEFLKLPTAISEAIAQYLDVADDRAPSEPGA